MHNFASGLRRVKDGARFPPGAREEEPTGQGQG